MDNQKEPFDDAYFWKRVSEAGAGLDVGSYVHQKRGSRFLNRLFWFIAGGVLRSYFHVKVTGLENLPSPPYILTPNHTSHLDTLSIYYALGRQRQKSLSVMAAKDYFFKNKIMGYFFKSVLSAIPIGRSGDFFEGLNCAKQLVDRGRIILIFPEGTRSTTGNLQPFRPGIGLLITMLDVPVIPVKLTGPFDLWPKGKSLPKRGDIAVNFGKPFIWPPDVPRKKFDQNSFQKVADLLHDAVNVT